MIVLRRGASRSLAPTIESGKKYLLLYNSYMLNKKISYTFFTVGVIFFMSGCVSTPDSAVETEQIDIEKTNEITVVPASSTPTPIVKPSSTPTPTEVPTATPVVVLPPEPIVVQFMAADGQELSGLYFPADENPAPIIVLMPWSLGNQSDWEEVAYWLQGRGLLVRTMNSRKTWKSSNWYPERTLDMPLGVFTFNFRACEGEGGCQAYMPAGWLLDAQAAMETASQLEGVDPGKIIAAGASIGADGAVDSCAWINTTDLGTCLGAFTLSPSSSLTIDFRTAVDALLSQENPAEVYCLYGLRDSASQETCGDYPEIRAVNYGYVEDRGLELILVDRKPDPLDILQEFIFEALGGAQ
ncbi:MAG: hypothetical protein DRI65_15685 [Chloroflexota bacterium]|nr:MAG: hypothetical protein DRI65_15685 [Chloroflexota bacterium]